VPGNLCNSYRIKPRGRQLIRGWRKGGGGWCNHKATDTHRYPPTYIHIFLHGFDNRIRIRFIVRVPWPYQLHSARQRLAFSPLLPLFFIYLFFFCFLVRKPQNYIELGLLPVVLAQSRKPKAQSQSQLIADSGHVNF